MKLLLWLALAICLPLVIAKADLWRRRHIGDALAFWRNETMPAELRTGTLFMSEQEIATAKPVALHGRVDQVFQTKRGVLVPIDTKLRGRHTVYQSDIIQLSVYRTILAHQYRQPVANHGYVRAVVEHNGKESVRYIKTPLLSETRLIELVHRYDDLRSGRENAVCSCSGKLHGAVASGKGKP